MRVAIFRLSVLAGLLAVALSGCAHTHGPHDEFQDATSLNPEFAGSLKGRPGLFPPPPRLSELPGSRVREGE